MLARRSVTVRIARFVFLCNYLIDRRLRAYIGNFHNAEEREEILWYSIWPYHEGACLILLLHV